MHVLVRTNVLTNEILGESHNNVTSLLPLECHNETQIHIFVGCAGNFCLSPALTLQLLTFLLFFQIKVPLHQRCKKCTMVQHWGIILL